MELKLWNEKIPYEIEEGETPNQMTTYFIETTEPLPCVVVFPGGGYHKRAPHEGGPIAQFFNGRGMHAVVVDYRVAPNRFPSGLCDAQRAVRLVRAHAEKWKIDPNRVFTCGFSAGGHLTGSTLLFGDMLPSDWERDEADSYSCTPNGGILCYPVISVEEEYGHVGSGKNLLGEAEYAAKCKDFSLQYKVTEQTPKAFLWHTSDDPVVNVKNSLIFGERLRDCGIPFEMHVYPSGKHGLGLALDKPDISGWADLAADWIERNF